jgi:hypothetical protein
MYRAGGINLPGQLRLPLERNWSSEKQGSSRIEVHRLGWLFVASGFCHHYFDSPLP